MTKLNPCGVCGGSAKMQSYTTYSLTTNKQPRKTYEAVCAVCKNTAPERGDESGASAAWNAASPKEEEKHED